MNESVILINASGSARIQSGHLWVYRGDIIDIGTAAAGEVVRIATTKGRFLGRAFFSSESQIALRLITREDVPIDRQFWMHRLEAADAARKRIFPGQSVYRLLFSDSDLCSSIIVDRYGEYLCLQTLSQGAERLKGLLLELLQEYFQPRAIVVRNDGKVRELEGLPQKKNIACGILPETLQIPFNDKLWNVDLLNGQKTGMFLDQRENYQAAQIYARGQVLDAFSYAGGFGIHCATGAANVECVDIAEPALALVRRNLEVNRLENVTTVLDNCFDLLRCYQDSGRRFDMIVLDPPAFAKSRAAVGQAKKGYKEINLRALKILNPGGHLVTCSCSYHISSLQFAQLLRQAAADAHREVQVVEIRGQGRDHPVLLSMPETQYLKCWILRAF